MEHSSASIELSDMEFARLSNRTNDKRVYAKWSNSQVGYGLFAQVPLPEKTCIGIITGVITDMPLDLDYTWKYPGNSDKSQLYLDSSKKGNLLRFVNVLSIQHCSNISITIFLT